MIRREESSEDLLTTAEAALILSKNSKRDIRPQYVNQLVRQKRITPHRLDARTNLYRRGDVEQIVIAPRGGKHIQNHSKRKPKRKEAASEEAA